MIELTKPYIKEQIEGNLARSYGISPSEATERHMFDALCQTVRDILRAKEREFSTSVKKQKGKTVYYFSMEFLVGPALFNNLFNLKIDKLVADIIDGYGMKLEDLVALDPDPGLGNGGLGRLAACFMDSLATLGYPARGYCIRYDFGLFKQKLIDGWQTELPDNWLPDGEQWLIPRNDDAMTVKFDGQIEEKWTGNGLEIAHYNYTPVTAVPYDFMISGYDSDAAVPLRLWKAVSPLDFDMSLFSQGQYARAMEKSAEVEAISKFLYPPDEHFEGKSLRLRQQYFLVSAGLQDIVRRHLKVYGTLDNLQEKAAIHINDTHPALAVPELMRILIDEHRFDWDKAWYIVNKTVCYTNHTVMAEALETWDEHLIERRLPRIYNILKEINERFTAELWNRYPGNWNLIEKMSIMSQHRVRMANLSIVSGHSINGVAKIHSDILKNDVFKDFYNMMPDKFTNVTNGIAHRRFLCQANPKLSNLIAECIGDGFIKDASELSKFADFADDKNVLERLYDIKSENKRAFADYMKKQGVILDPDTMWNSHIKRIHEYKRQLLNILHVISLYHQLKENPGMDFLPQTFIFAGKAAGSYHIAKRIINLIWAVGKEIEKHPEIAKKLKVVFIENYSVSLAEKIMPATEVSQQISLAGKEASGTGNMKLMLNGAVTIGTMAGANVEICEAVGPDNIFIFGMNEREVDFLWKNGYNPANYYAQNPALKKAVDSLIPGFYGYSFKDIYDYLIKGERGMPDPYMCLADFGNYAMVYHNMTVAYQNKPEWNRRSLLNIANAGGFAADRSVSEYAGKIWRIKQI